MTTGDADERRASTSEGDAAAVSWAVEDWPALLAPQRRRHPGGAVVRLLGAGSTVVAVLVVALLGWPSLASLAGASAQAPIDRAIGEGASAPGGAPAEAPVAGGPEERGQLREEPRVSAPRPAASAAAPAIDAVVATLGTPGYVEITPDGRQAWIAHRDSRNERGEHVISVLDLRLGTIVAAIPSLAGPPRFITFCPPGTAGAGRAYVSVYSVRPDGRPDHDAPHLVSVIDQSTLVETGRISVGRRPFASTCSPDGANLVVPSHDDGRLDIIDTASSSLRTSVAVPPNPHWAAHDARGQIWTANHESNAVTRVNATTLTVEADDIINDVGRSPHAVAVDPESARVAVVCFDSHELYLFDVETGAVLRTVALGRGPQDVAWTSDGARVLTTDVDDDRVSVVDAGTGVITATLQPPAAQPGIWDGPTSIAITPDGSTAVVTLLNSSAVALIDLTGA